MPENDQQPIIHPGFAIFCFPAGIVEMVARISVVVMLIVCLVSSAIVLTSDNIIGSSLDNEEYDSLVLQTVTALWVVMVTGIALIFELIYFVLRFLNIRCYNNCYTLYGILDIVRYVLLVICLVIGCFGFVVSVYDVRSRADRCDRRSEAAGEVDTACEELRDRATTYILMAVSCGVAAGVVIVAVVWEAIYLATCSNNRLPVPREGDKA